jgi:hypothetical protein
MPLSPYLLNYSADSLASFVSAVWLGSPPCNWTAGDHIVPPAWATAPPEPGTGAGGIKTPLVVVAGDEELTDDDEVFF